MADGVLVVDKPRGVTSFWVVQRVRRLAGERKVGHAGTLDPLATGVLLVCLGKATKIVQFLMEGDKTYAGTMTLGRVTDTYDADGRVVEEKRVDPGLDLETVRAAAREFEGVLMQEPPAFSAAKHKGQPLYKLARKGIRVRKEPREIRVKSFEIEEVDLPLVRFQVTCSKGTYVRSLVHDLGARLGCGAFLSSLTRTASGPFSIEQAVSLEELEAAAGEGRLEEVVVPVSKALAHFPAVEVDREMAEQIRRGIPVAGSLVSGACSGPGGAEGGFVRLMCGRELVAVVPCGTAEETARSLIKPVKVWPRTDNAAAV